MIDIINRGGGVFGSRRTNLYSGNGNKPRAAQAGKAIHRRYKSCPPQLQH